MSSFFKVPLALWKMPDYQNRAAFRENLPPCEPVMNQQAAAPGRCVEPGMHEEGRQKDKGMEAADFHMLS